MTETGSTTQNSNRKTMISLAGFAVLMLCAGFASKPLYDTFCRVTGYGGTTQVAEAKSDTVLDRDMDIRFDANVNPDLGWSFKPETRKMTVKVGQNVLAYYVAKNMTDEPIVGTATYNVAPIKAATYFAKLECFCFTEQKLMPGEEVRMPVLFFVDPLIEEDERGGDVKEITLSYTFHKVGAPTQAAQTTEDRDARLKQIQSVDLSQ